MESCVFFIILGGYRMRYPLCFVLMTDENENLDGIVDQSPRQCSNSFSNLSDENLSCEITTDKCKTTVAPNKSPKNGVNSRVCKRKSRMSSKSYRSESTSIGSIPLKASLRSDILLDVQRSYLAREALNRASQNNTLPVPTTSHRKHTRKLDTCSPSKELSSSGTSGASPVHNSGLYSLTLQDFSASHRCNCAR